MVSHHSQHLDPPGNGEPGNGEALKDQTVPIFLLSVYKRKEAKEEDIMYEIGIRRLVFIYAVDARS